MIHPDETVPSVCWTERLNSFWPLLKDSLPWLSAGRAVDDCDSCFFNRLSDLEVGVAHVTVLGDVSVP